MVKLKMFVGRLLCTTDQRPLSFLREWSNRNEIIAPWESSWCAKRSLLSDFTAFSTSLVLR